MTTFRTRRWIVRAYRSMGVIFGTALLAWLLALGYAGIAVVSVALER